MIQYDHLSEHSLLVKTIDKLGRWGWFMIMGLAWKKSQETLEIQNSHAARQLGELYPAFTDTFLSM